MKNKKDISQVQRNIQEIEIHIPNLESQKKIAVSCLFNYFWFIYLFVNVFFSEELQRGGQTYE